MVAAVGRRDGLTCFMTKGLTLRAPSSAASPTFSSLLLRRVSLASSLRKLVLSASFAAVFKCRIFRLGLRGGFHA